MKLIYLFHSGLALETERVIVLFDFFKDSFGEAGGSIQRLLAQTDKKLYVLASHFHPDHFTREVLEWKEQRPDIVYLFSNDVLKHRRASKDEAVFLRKGESWKDNDLEVEAFGSTDVGVSFLVHLEGKTIFHAGDLNNWHWSEESTPDEVKKAEGDFLAELKYLHARYAEIDLVMFPVDARIGKDYDRGAKRFVETIKTHTFVPIHFSEYPEQAALFQAVAERNGAAFLYPTHPGATFEMTF